MGRILSVGNKKSFFIFITLSLAKFLKEDAHSYTNGDSDVEKLAAVDKWKHSNFLYRNYVLNGLDNTLYNMYSNVKSAKELWESLDTKYKIDDVSTKTFIVGWFLDYKMVDNKTVISQVQELQIILSDIHAEGMKLSESFQVTALIEKLPSSWKDFKNYLKHKQKEMKLEDIIVRLRIEEDNRKSEKRNGTSNLLESNANIVEWGLKTNKKKRNGEGQTGSSKTVKKFKGNCYNCDKVRHWSKDFRKTKNAKGKAHKANVKEHDNLFDMVQDMNLSAVISECNLVDNTKEWWVDIGATRHIYSNRGMFSTYKATNNEEQLYMGNSSSSKVEGHGKIVLKMTSGKELTLNEVLHVPDIQKKLVSNSLLSKNGFKLVFISDKFVFTKNDMFVGKGYLNKGLFKLNVMIVVPHKNKITYSYLLESFNIWHEWLGYVNYNICVD